jgi:hypothetical protein
VQAWLNRGKRKQTHEGEGELEREPLVAAE